MGNCCSTTTTSTDKEADENAHHLHADLKKNRTDFLPTSYTLLEEESVKEVLTETPTMPKRPAVFRNHQEPRKFTPPLFPNFRNFSDGKPRRENSGIKKPTMIYNNPEDFSEDASEICSTHSESISAATYFTEKNDNDDDVLEIRQRSPAKLRNRSLSGEIRRERSTGGSPVKKSDASPNRLRSSGSLRDNRSLIPNVQKRDFGERSGRRSRSPATRTDGGGVAKMGLNRSGSTARKTGKSPGRVRSEVGEKIRKLEDDETKSVSREERWPPTSNESLENPLVSLECFIFL